MIRRRAEVFGRVQGVGFRYFCLEEAERRGLKGWVRNRPDGAVELEAEGGEAAVEEFLGTVRRGFPGARVERMETGEARVRSDEDGFQISH